MEGAIGDAEEAIEALQSKFAVDLVFTDINLGEGMNGLELAGWTLSHRPGVKVVVTTGISQIELPPEVVEPLLAKPYTGRSLLDRVKQALAKQAGDGS